MSDYARELDLFMQTLEYRVGQWGALRLLDALQAARLAVEESRSYPTENVIKAHHD